MKTLLSFLLAVSGLHAADTTFVFVRHGETDWNVEKKAAGHTDIPLNETGRVQADEAAEKLALSDPNIDLIVSSDLQRAVHTARPLASKLGLEITTNAAFREMNFGEGEGKTLDQRSVEYQEFVKRFLQLERMERWNTPYFPGAETQAQVVARFKEALTELAKNHTGKKIAIFSHGRALRMLIGDTLGIDYDTWIPNCGIVRFTISDDGVVRLLQIDK